MTCNNVRLTSANGEPVEFRPTPDGVEYAEGDGAAIRIPEVRYLESQQRILFPGTACKGVFLKKVSAEERKAALDSLRVLLEAKHVQHNLKASGAAARQDVFEVGSLVQCSDRVCRVLRHMASWNRYELEDQAGASFWRDGRALRALPKVALSWDPRMTLHGAYEERPPLMEMPEQSDRGSSVWDGLVAEGLEAKCERVDVSPASKDEICLVHTPEHYARVMACDPACLCDEDNDARTPLTEGSPLAARLAAGCVTGMMRRVVEQKVPAGFCVVRPPGHHACADKAMGFCLFNNVCVAASVAKKDYGLTRILILDWDVHHGNGIQDIFYDDPQVLYVSLHVRAGGRFYPGTGQLSEVGAKEGIGYNVNVAWRNTGAGDDDYRAAFDSVVMPIAADFDPELVFISAGFDAAEGDPLGECHVSPECFRWMTSRLLTLADGRVVAAMEGGYNTEVLASCSAAVLSSLMYDSFTRGALVPMTPLSPAPMSPPAGLFSPLSPSGGGFAEALNAAQKAVPVYADSPCSTATFQVLVDVCKYGGCSRKREEPEALFVYTYEPFSPSSGSLSRTGLV